MPKTRTRQVITIEVKKRLIFCISPHSVFYAKGINRISKWISIFIENKLEININMAQFCKVFK